MSKAALMAGLSALQLAAKLQQGYKSLAPFFKGRPGVDNNFNLPRPTVSQATPKFSGRKRKAPYSFKGSKRSLWSKRRKTGKASLWYHPHHLNLFANLESTFLSGG